MKATDKSYVSMEQKVCVACCETFDSGAILLDKRLKNSMERHTVTGWGFCPECQAKIDDGFMILVGANSGPNGATLKPDTADRTGDVIYLRRAVAEKIFTVPDLPDMIFVDPDVVKLMKDRIAHEGDIYP